MSRRPAAEKEAPVQIPLQITFREIDPSPAIEANIREKVERLERFSDRITSCRVVVEAKNTTHRKGRVYTCAVDITVPGEEIVVGRVGPKNHAHEDVYVAIRDSFNTATRLLEDHARRMRADVKTHQAPLHGKVARLHPGEGYGFIELPDGQEIYFHENSVVNGKFAALTEGSEVRLVVAENESEKGAQASTVTPVGKHHIME
jgi:ribosomal subunit interface protein